MLGQLGLRDDAIAMVHQVGQDAKFVAGELDRQAIERHLRRANVDDDRSAAKLRRHLPAGAPDQRAQTREHFLHPERLRHVVVGAAVYPLHLLVPAAARGQHQYGD